MSTQPIETLEKTVDRKFDVTVIYNGISKEITVNSQETIKAVLEQAIHAFGPLPSPHTLALYTAAGVELTNEQQSVKEAGIEPHDKLLLRPSTVKGGNS